MRRVLKSCRGGGVKRLYVSFQSHFLLLSHAPPPSLKESHHCTTGPGVREAESRECALSSYTPKVSTGILKGSSAYHSTFPT